jgi:pimeloyl-ACP methyl ester carboxylesterase
MNDRDGRLEINGARLRVRVVGAGPAVLFIHGWALDLDMWTPQLEALASRYRLIAYDRRGFGLSSGTPGVEQDVSDIGPLLAALAIDRVAVVGMSQGARVALHWSLRNLQRVSCLVLDGPPFVGPGSSSEPQEIPLAEYRVLLRNAGIDAVRGRWLEHPLTQLYRNDERARELLLRIVGRYPGNDLAVEEPLLPAESLRDLTLPTLVVNGEHDSAARRAAGAMLADTLPAVRQVIVPQAGHLPNLDHAEVYNAILEAFLAVHQGSRAG